LCMAENGAEKCKKKESRTHVFKVNQIKTR
jgi:hypothetical protein